MPVRAPLIQWPETLGALGPADDPNILLVGEAWIAGAEFMITAIRMRKGMRMPDYRDGVAPADYEAALDSMLDEIEYLASTMAPALVPMDGGEYLIWMVPSAGRKARSQNEEGSEPA